MAALRAHPGDVIVQRKGCASLGRIAEGGAACAQAVAYAGGAAAAVAALRAHPGDVDVQRGGCVALCRIAAGGAACAQAVAEAGGAAAAVAAKDFHPLEFSQSGRREVAKPIITDRLQLYVIRDCFN